MKYLAYAFLAILILVVVVWQIAVGLIGLGLFLFKILLIIGAIFFFWLGWSMRGLLENHGKNKAVEYFANTQKN